MLQSIYRRNSCSQLRLFSPFRKWNIGVAVTYTEEAASRVYLCCDGDSWTDGQTRGRLIDQTASLLLIYSDRKSITCSPLISPPLVPPAAPTSPLFSLAPSGLGDLPMQMCDEREGRQDSVPEFTRVIHNRRRVTALSLCRGAPSPSPRPAPRW